MTRPLHIWLLFGVCLAVLLAALGWVSVTTLRLDRGQMEGAQQAGIEENVRLADELSLPEGATLNPGVTLGGGIFYGIVPGEAEFGVDIRTVPGMTLEALRGEVLAFIERLRAENPALDVEVEWVPGLEWFPPSSIDPGHPLVAAAGAAGLAVLGREVPLGVMPAFTDGTNWSLAGMPSIPAFGPGMLPLAHRPNEYVEVREIVEAARIYALTALRFLGG